MILAPICGYPFAGKSTLLLSLAAAVTDVRYDGENTYFLCGKTPVVILAKEHQTKMKLVRALGRAERLHDNPIVLFEITFTLKLWKSLLGAFMTSRQSAVWVDTPVETCLHRGALDAGTRRVPRGFDMATRAKSFMLIKNDLIKAQKEENLFVCTIPFGVTQDIAVGKLKHFITICDKLNKGEVYDSTRK